MVQKRKSKRFPNYTLELMEQRRLLSASITAPLFPAGWQAHPIGIEKYPVTVDGVIQPELNGSTIPFGLTPAQMTGAYDVGGITFNGTAGTGAGQTIAIVDAYDLPGAAADLSGFDAYYGLQDPPSFEQVNEQGQPNPLPTTDPAGAGNDDWESEEALDIEWAHVMAPAANIILVEVDNPGDLLVGDAAASRLPGVSVISNSWGGDEYNGETGDDSTFVTPTGHQGVTFVFAAGDSGAFGNSAGTETTITPNYPASSPNVVSVGGTTLDVNGDTYASESAWGEGDSSGTDPDGGGGGGISTYETQPQYQKFLDSDSTTNRTYPDVAMEADPSTGVPVYDTYDNGATTPWFGFMIGGTSLSTPMFSGLIAIANQGRVLAGATTLNGITQTVPRLYTLPEADYHDIVSGSNGYDAGPGYDLATGRGSPVANLLVPDLASNYIGFHAFQDTNNDGYQDDQEPGIAGVTASLYTPGADGLIGTGDDVLIATTTTDSYGLYEFTNLTPGTYYVHFVLPTGEAITTVTNAGPATSNSVVNPATGDTGAIVIGEGTEDAQANVGAAVNAISIDSVTVTRPHVGFANMDFTVSLAPASLTATTITYTTENGTAIAGFDYVATSGTLTIPAGASTADITVEAIGNLIIENDVTFSVVISVPPGYTSSGNVGVGTILNSNFPAAAVAGPSPQTRSAALTLVYPFTVSLSATAPFPVTVPYSTADNTAISGLDYIAQTGTLTFPAGTQTQVIDILVLPGTNAQANKTFEVNVSSSATATLGSPTEAIGTIITNSPPGISMSNSTVTESLTGITYLPFTVNVLPSQVPTVTVDYTTEDGTAIAGKDYVAESGTLTFTTGRYQQTVYVPVPQQFIAAQDKTLTFAISNASSGLPIYNATVTGTINYPGLVALAFSAKQKAVYTDSLNQRVTVSMKGVGSGDAIFIGSISNATNAYEILVNGTNAASAVSVKVAGGGQTSLTNVTINSSLGSFLAPGTNILSAVNASAGSLSTLTLGYAAAANITVGGAGSGQTLAVNFGRAVNTTITSAISIRLLSAGAYINTTGSPIYITAPSVTTVKVTGNFGGTIRSASVASLIVGGEIEGGGILAGSTIGSVSAASIVDSTFYAGVIDGVTAMPASASDFSNTQSAIKSINVKGGVFSDTQISGWKVGTVFSSAKKLAAGTVSISGSTIGKVKTAATAASKFTQLTNPTSDTAVGNVDIDLI